MHDFRDNAATFLLATPSASRGLDLPAVSHVYNLTCPDVTTYLHQAGRAGRIGSPVQGKPNFVVHPHIHFTSYTKAMSHLRHGLK